jgi:hypothetical protein
VLTANRKTKLIDATLEWCNERRAEQGREPLTELPKGKREDPNSCPCGKATGLYVDFTTYVSLGEDGILDGKTGGDLPHDVCEFVENFDNGFIPELNEFREYDATF